jgi:hypothetical protein
VNFSHIWEDSTNTLQQDTVHLGSQTSWRLPVFFNLVGTSHFLVIRFDNWHTISSAVSLQNWELLDVTRHLGAEPFVFANYDLSK